MSTKRIGNLWLYLAIACFLGIVAVFFVDGYMGVYDVVEVRVGDVPHKIEPDYWERDYAKGDGYYIYEVRQGDVVQFSYQIANRRFSDLRVDVEVFLLEGGQEIKELFSGGSRVNVFSLSPVYEWTVDTTELEVPGEYGGHTYTVNISRGGVERKVRFQLAQPAKYLPSPRYE
ncbi:MAG: hypothetical protein J7L90_01055 [Dehalococcoidia bacterium]|nr:hypothetical protein [Dehalococcoidia bacterium]